VPEAVKPLAWAVL